MYYQLLTIFLTVGVSNALYDRNDDVVLLSPEKFTEQVVNSDSVWIVEFFAPWCGHCKALVPEYRKAASALKGIVQVGAINADEHQHIGNRYGVNSYPTIKIFVKNKRQPVAYTGERTARSLIDTAINTLRNLAHTRLDGPKITKRIMDTDMKDVVELTDDNFDEMVLNSKDLWLVEFYAPWCQHCKNLAPQWAEASRLLKGKMKLGAVDVTIYKRKADEYGIQALPMMKYFPRFSKNANYAEHYDGGRTTTLIVDWALDRISLSIGVHQLVDNETMETHCSEDTSLCVITILPDIYDCNATCRNQSLNLLKTIAQRYRKHMWGFLWAEALSQPHVEDALDLGGFGYPAMAIVNRKKMHYALFKGAFDEDGLNIYFRDLSHGRGSAVLPIKGGKIPEIITIAMWDGEDGQLLIEGDYDEIDDEKDIEKNDEKDEKTDGEKDVEKDDEKNDKKNDEKNDEEEKKIEL